MESTDTTSINPSTENKSGSGFNRVLGLTSLIAVGVGLVVSQGIMAQMLMGVGIAGLGFFIPLTIAFLVALTYVASFSELSLMFPKAGGFSTYTKFALGHFPALLGTYSGYVVVAMFALPTELLLVDLLFDAIYPGAFPPMVLGCSVLLLFTLLNIIGVDIFAKVQTALAFTMIVSLAILGLTATSGMPDGRLAAETLWENWNPTGVHVFALVTLALWGFVGAEFICPLAEETKSPERNIPRSMFLSVTIIFAVFVVYCLGAIYYVPTSTLLESPLPHLHYAKAVFGNFGLVFISVAGLTAVCSTVNTTLAAVPRMLYGMAADGQALPIFGRLHRRYQTPWVAIVFMAGLVGLPLTILSAENIGQMLISAALCWLFAYLIAHFNVLALRIRFPTMHRPYKTPFYPWPQILGIVGILYALAHGSPTPEMAASVYGNAIGVLFLVSVCSFLWIKLVMKKDLFSPSPID
ncbi:MAG: amino acid transporter [Halieaceae bacterium]|jgi:amino acid transporter